VSETAAIDMTLPAATADFFREAMRALREATVPFLVGGAYALYQYTGVERYTKDFDVFVRGEDARRALAVLSAAGFRTELTFPHWLGKASHGDDFVDVIFSSGNGVARVDDEWFHHAVVSEVLGLSVLLVPVEEIIWQKVYIQERERFDGADIAHLIRARCRDLDWPRLLRRVGPHWRVLLAQLVLFGFIYPSQRDCVPEWVMNDLMARLQAETVSPPPPGNVCPGTLLSREQYLIDIERWGLVDAREGPHGPMSHADVIHWTRAIIEHPSPPAEHMLPSETGRD
jgi:hypothetical protein